MRPCVDNEQSSNARAYQQKFEGSDSKTAETPVADLEGGGAGSAPPPLRRTDAVTHGMLANVCRSIVKHRTQNIQNDCHQWLSGSFRVHQIRFRPGLRPRPNWGSLQRSPRPPRWFKRTYF